MLAGSCLAQESQSRKVDYGETDVITIRTKVRFTTLVILPKEESILDFTCGDKEFWVVDGARNLAYIKPAKTGLKTNVNLVTASGNVYSLLLEEVSDKADAVPDLKLFLRPKDESVLSTIKGAPRFVAAEELLNFREQVSIAKDEAKEAKQNAEKAIDTTVTSFLAEYPRKLRFGYRYVSGRKPFFVDAIWNDGRLTYIQTHATELPSVYEIKDGKPDLVNFDIHDSLITVGKVIDHGYLSIGKTRLCFHRKEKS
jgi:type IV secretion system protein VirB9